MSEKRYDIKIEGASEDLSRMIGKLLFGTLSQKRKKYAAFFSMSSKLNENKEEKQEYAIDGLSQELHVKPTVR